MAKTDRFCNRAEAYEAHDNVPLSPLTRDTIGDIILERYSRRDMMRGTLGVVAAAALFGPAALASGNARGGDAADRFNFAGGDGRRRRDPPCRRRLPGATSCSDGATRCFPTRLPSIRCNQSAEAQLKQFGYNNDYMALLPDRRSERDRGLLCVNHEYTNEEMMFPGVGRQDLTGFTDMTRGARRYRDGGAWRHHRRDRASMRRMAPVRRQPLQSPHQAAMTEMAVDGPAAGHDRLKTKRRSIRRAASSAPSTTAPAA